MSNYDSASISQANYDYVGQFNETGLRYNYGCQNWDHLQHKYAGYFLYNNLHGKGFYFVQKEHYNTFYDGQFYNNELEGYGQVIHKDGTIFEGLFKKNRRFGPGVLTYPDGKQDVGLWNGLSLIRLSIKLCGDTVPMLGKSVLGKTKLLRFKKIVPASDNFNEPAKNILCNMEAPPEIIDSYMRLYNPQVRNENSLFFDRRHYNLSHFGSEDCFIDVIKESDSKIVIENESMGETDDVCFCSNERCVQLGHQIAGLKLKMASLDETIKHYETQLNTCGLCTVSKNSPSNQDESEAIIHEEISCLCDRRMDEIEDVIESELEKIKLDRLFYQTAIDFLNHKYHQEISSINDFNGKPETTKVMVKHLLAWNNEDLAVEILQHCFRYRNFEDNINFNIKTLLTGDREKFGKPGSYERNCFKFLNHCKDGNCLEASRTLLKYTLNPDLCDGRGNTGMHLAASKNHRDIIQLLTNCGANLNITNDECLSPLLICLVLYLACLHHVVDWEKAFLCDVTLDEKEIAEVTQWRPHESLLNLKVSRYFDSSGSSIHSFSSRNSTNMYDDIASNIQLNLDGNTNDYFLLSMRYLKKDDAKIHNTLIGKSVKPLVNRIEDKANTILADTKKLDEISKTVDALLYYGANPNVGTTPLPPVLLAIFTKNPKIVENLLEHNGNPNTMLEENLSPLHILVSLEPCDEYVKICEIFLKHSSDPNIETEVNHWADQNNSLIGAYGNRSTPGRKTALQMLCMREDFRGDDQAYFSEMARALLQHGAIYDTLFLGHTPLSLAVLRGNVDLVKTLCDYVDYNKPLGENMGNALTVLALTRYPYAIPFHECKAVIDQLLESSMNPFNSIYDFPNVFEFLRSETPPIKNSNKPKVQAKIETGLCRLRKIVNSNKIKTITKKCNLLSKEYLMQCGRNILMIRHKFQAILYFYTFVDLNFLQDVCVKNLAKFFTVDDALVYLKMLVQSGLIRSNFFSRELAISLLKFVQKINKTKKDQAKKKKSKASKGKLSFKRSQPAPTIEELVNNMDFNTKSSTKLFENIFDDHNDGYEVCCYCLEKTDRVILHCPGCGIVSYCSVRCNKYGNQLNKLYHKCKGSFYNKMKRLYDQSISSGTPFPNRIELVLHKAAEMWSEQQVSSAETKHCQSVSLMHDKTNVPDERKFRTVPKIGYSKGFQRKGATVESYAEDTTYTDSPKFRSMSERNRGGSKRSMEDSYGVGKEEQYEESKNTRGRREVIRTVTEPEQSLEGPQKSIREYSPSRFGSYNTRSRSEASRAVREPEQNLERPRKSIREYGASLMESNNTRNRSKASRAVREPDQSMEGPRKSIREYGPSFFESNNTRNRSEAFRAVREPEQNMEGPRKSIRDYGATFIESGMNNSKKRMKTPGVRMKRELSFLTDSQSELVKRKYQGPGYIATEIRTFIIEDDMMIIGESAQDEKVDEVSLDPMKRLEEKTKYGEIYEMKGDVKFDGEQDKDTKIGIKKVDAPKSQPEKDLRTFITKDRPSFRGSDKYSDVHKITDSMVDAIRTGMIKEFGDDTKQSSMTTRTGIIKNGRKADTSAKYHGIDGSLKDRTGPQELAKPDEIKQVEDSSMKNARMDNITDETLSIARAMNTKTTTRGGTSFGRRPADELRSGIKNEGKHQKLVGPDEANQTSGTMEDETNLTTNANYAESVSSPAYETRWDIMKNGTTPQGIGTRGVIKDGTSYSINDQHTGQGVIGSSPADETRSGILKEGTGPQRTSKPDGINQTTGNFGRGIQTGIIKDEKILSTNVRYGGKHELGGSSTDQPGERSQATGIRNGKMYHTADIRTGIMKDGSSLETDSGYSRKDGMGGNPAGYEIRSGVIKEEIGLQNTVKDGDRNQTGVDFVHTQNVILKDGTDPEQIPKFVKTNTPVNGTKTGIKKEETSLETKAKTGVNGEIGGEPANEIQSGLTKQGTRLQDIQKNNIMNQTGVTAVEDTINNTMKDRNGAADANYVAINGIGDSPADGTQSGRMKDVTALQIIDKKEALIQIGGGLVRDPRSFIMKDRNSFGKGTKIEGTYKITNVPMGLPQTVILKVETSLGKSTLKIDIDDLVKNGQTGTLYGTILSKNGKQEAIEGTGLIPKSDIGLSNNELVKSSLWGYSTGKLDILGGEIHTTEVKDAKKIDQDGIASRISDTDIATETGKGEEVISKKEKEKQIDNKEGGEGGTKIGIEKVKTVSKTRMVLNKLKTSYEGESKSSRTRSTINLDMKSKSGMGETLGIDKREKRSRSRVARDQDNEILVESRSKIKSTLSLHPDTKPELSQVSYEKIQTSLWDYAKGKMQESAENIYLTVEKPRKPKHAEDELDGASSRKRRLRGRNTSRFFDSRGNLIDYETWKRVGGKIYDSKGNLIDPEAWNENRRKFYDSKGNLINPEEWSRKGGKVYDSKGNLVGPEIWSMKGRKFFDSRGNLINPEVWSKGGGKVYDSRGNLVGPEVWSMKGRKFYDSKGNLINPVEWSKRGGKVYDSKGNLVSPETWNMKGRNFFDSKGNLVDREEWSKRGGRVYDSKGNLIPRSGRNVKFGGRRGRIRSGRRTRGKSRSGSRKSGSGRGSSRRGDATGKEGGTNLGRYNSMPLGAFRGALGDTQGGAARLSKLYRYFLELLVKYFPEFELGCLLFPFAVFNEGQLYYKFSEVSPIYGRTYSVV